MSSPLLVLGGGAAGMAAALEASRDIKVILIEESSRLGGWAGKYSCKATDSCQGCGACRVRQLEEAVRNNDSIEILTGWKAVAMKPPTGAFQRAVVIARGEQRREIEAKAVVIATGFSPFDARLWGEYGYGRYPRVITSLDLEEVWREVAVAGEKFPGMRWLAFIQCVGSRTTRPGGNPFCSRVCCDNTLRLAGKLLWENPYLRIDVFHNDLQSGERQMEEASRKPGINLVRSIPSRIYQLPGRLVTVNWEDPAGGERVGEYDLVVLSVGMIKKLFVFEAEQMPVEPGLFLAGAAEGPMDIRESIQRGMQVGTQVKQWVRTLKTASG